MTYGDIKALALRLGITTLIGKDLADYARYSDGCTYLSRLYALRSRHISCHRACVAHDFLYERGGDEGKRRRADILLRLSAARSGNSPAGRLGALPCAWRWCRAWMIYGAVRVGGRWFWNK